MLHGARAGEKGAAHQVHSFGHGQREAPFVKGDGVGLSGGTCILVAMEGGGTIDDKLHLDLWPHPAYSRRSESRGSEEDRLVS